MFSNTPTPIQRSEVPHQGQPADELATPALPSTSPHTAPALVELRGLSSIASFATPENPRLLFNNSGGYLAAICNAKLHLVDLTSERPLTKIIDAQAAPLNSSALGWGGFSADGSKLLLATCMLPAKVAALDVESFFGESGKVLSNGYFSALGSRHIFSPTGAFILSYSTTMGSMALLWMLDIGPGSMRISSGGNFTIEGTPTAEAIDSKGDTAAIATQFAREGASHYQLMLTDGSKENTLKLGHHFPIRRVVFSNDGRHLAFGDESGQVTLIDRLIPGELSQIGAFRASQSPVTALLDLTEEDLFIVAHKNGEVWAVRNMLHDPINVSAELLGQIHNDNIFSLSRSGDGRTIGVGLQRGGVAVLARTQI